MRGTPIPRCQTAALPLLVVAALLCTGCHSPLMGRVPEQRLQDGGEFHIVAGLDVPAVRGPQGCGAQAAATVLAYNDQNADAAALADELPWHDIGATPVDLLLAARARGYRAQVERGSWKRLTDEVQQNQPVLVMFDAGYEVRSLTLRLNGLELMHWGVVSGIARDGSQLLLAARGAHHHVVERDDFMERWSKSDYCMIMVTKPPAADRKDE